jgi:periplasmic divalent cation tolerance protein
MEDASAFCLVMVTAPDLETARKLVGGALEAHLAACGNIVSGLESHYWWQGKIEQASEVLILFKTVKTSLSKLENHISAAHPYDTPEIIALDLTSGSAKYLQWIYQSCQ